MAQNKLGAVFYKEQPLRKISFLPKVLWLIILACFFAFHNLLGQAPTITTFTPANASVGSTITITGTNFDPAPDNNIVIFGATRAIVTTATNTQLTVTVPAGATFAPITELNTNTGLLAYSGKNFTPIFAPNKGDITAVDFDPKIDFTTGTSPFSVAIGDLDGDGKSDLAVTNYGNNTISVFRNTGNSGTISYAAKVDFITGSLPYSVSIGDLDGDGKADLAVNNYGSNSVSVFRNTGSLGAISYAAKVDFTTAPLPFSVAIGDLDGDGKADLVTSNDNGSVSVFRNTGSPSSISYAAKVDFTTGNAPFSVVIGDVDGDGKADLVTVNNTSTSVSVFRNTSSIGIISYAAKVDLTTGTNPASIAIGDLDKDGKADLAVTNYSSNTVSVFRNTSNSGTISYATKVDFTTGTNPRHVAMGDLDGDEMVDLVVVDRNSAASIYRNTGSSGTVNFAAKVDLPVGSFPGFVSIGDLDGDGKPDLAVSNNGSASVSIIRNNPSFSIPIPTITNFTPTSGVAGTTITITGTNFTGATAVTFGGTASTSFTVVSPTSITTTVGTGTSGTISVTTPAGTATSSGTFTFTFPDLITISQQPTSTAVCEGSTASFPIAATGTTNIIYQWQKFDGTVFVDLANGGAYSGATSASLNINTTGNVGAGDYRCKVSGDLTQDKFSNTVALTINVVPTAPTATGATSCIAAALTLNASGGSNGQYRWYTVATGGTPIAGEVNSSYITPALSTTTSYFAAINDGSCESARTAVVATINIPPAIPIITSSVPAIGNALTLCNTTPLALTAPAGFTLYNWSTGETTQQISINASGSYTVTVTDAVGCVSPSAAALVVTVLPSPCNNQPPVINTTNTTVAIEGFVSINLLDLISDADNNIIVSSLAVIQPPASGASTTLLNGILEIEYKGINFTGRDQITIQVCDMFGECTQQILEIDVIGDIEIYNGISPNEDGANDSWIIRYIELIPDTQENKVTIYNRWGDIVWEASDYNNTSIAFKGIGKNGSLLTTGTYFYKIEFKNRKSLTGYLYLKR